VDRVRGEWSRSHDESYLGLIHDILGTSLNPQERRPALLIVGVTPEEEIANAADDENYSGFGDSEVGREL
jgi:hypothetical protein